MSAQWYVKMPIDIEKFSEAGYFLDTRFRTRADFETLLDVLDETTEYLEFPEVTYGGDET